MVQNQGNAVEGNKVIDVLTRKNSDMVSDINKENAILHVRVDDLYQELQTSDANKKQLEKDNAELQKKVEHLEKQLKKLNDEKEKSKEHNKVTKTAEQIKKEHEKVNKKANKDSGK
ncbi:hypothetical protein [Gracilibacillus suaedae]|uniref:hypothetical protein n=1 Tax=Gracilibacillus suaedae TaxID=2820273 RepID=UPI001ABE8072|nr:hypothetical protein [Gracilibacillus suaedae]